VSKVCCSGLEGDCRAKRVRPSRYLRRSGTTRNTPASLAGVRGGELRPPRCRGR
jgi:hypothetical protein